MKGFKRIASLLLVLLLSVNMGVAASACERPEAHTSDDCEPQVYALIADRDIEIGTVTITNDADNIYVKYEIDDASWNDGEGWALYETDVHVERRVELFPLTSKGKPRVVKFDYRETHEGIQLYEETIPLENDGNVLVAAHAEVKRVEESSVTIAPYGGDSATSKQGLAYDYDEVKAIRSTTDAALVLESENTSEESDFYSLGFRDEEQDDAWVIIEFDSPITNGDGDDIRLVEDTWTYGTSYPLEQAYVYVSEDGEEWLSLGIADNQEAGITGTNYHTIVDFDLDDVDLDSARFVKVVDASDRRDFDSAYNGYGHIADGYDLNVVLALHDYEDIEYEKADAWIEGCKFVEKGSWAMYVNYEICDSEAHADDDATGEGHGDDDIVDDQVPGGVPNDGDCDDDYDDHHDDAQGQDDCDDDQDQDGDHQGEDTSIEDETPPTSNGDSSSNDCDDILSIFRYFRARRATYFTNIYRSFWGWR